MAKYTDKQALDELKRLIDEIDNVRKKPRLSPKFKAWKNETAELLERAFGRSSKQVKEFDRIPYSLAAFSNKTPDSKFDEAFHQGLKTAAIALSSAVKEIQTHGLGGASQKRSSGSAIAEDTKPVVSVSSSPRQQASGENKIAARAISQAVEDKKILFITASKNTVSSGIESFLSKMGLIPLLTNCSADQHSKLFEGINKYSDAGYAIVSMGNVGASDAKDMAYGLGILAGRLGPERVCVLIDDKMTGIDTYNGVSYVPIDAAGAWKFMMIKNLKTAGFDVDANLAL